MQATDVLPQQTKTQQPLEYKEDKKYLFVFATKIFVPVPLDEFF